MELVTIMLLRVGNETINVTQWAEGIITYLFVNFHARYCDSSFVFREGIRSGQTDRPWKVGMLKQKPLESVWLSHEKKPFIRVVAW